MKTATIIAVFLLLVSFAPCAEAISAMPLPVNFTLPNGRAVTTKIKGDEYISWITDANDYTLVPGSDGFLYYGTQLSNGLVGPSNFRADLSSPPSGLTKNILPTAAAYQATCGGKYCGSHVFNNVFGNRQVREGPDLGTDIGPVHDRRKLALKTGTVYNLLIPIRFADHLNRTLPTTDELAILMNNNGPHALCPTGSVRDVYKYNSYGKFNLTTVVADWVTSSGTESYWANGNRGLTTLTHSLIREALKLADPYVNFSKFDGDGDSYIDAIAFVHSGYGAEWGGTGYMNRIWSHKWQLYTGAYTSAEGVIVYDYHISPALWGTSGSSIGHAGVIAHETGHFLGLPDMYDGTKGQGVGSFDLMGNAWGFTGTQYYPPHFSIYSRLFLGWDTATTIQSNGFYTLSATEDQNPAYPRAYKITANFPSGEYLLIENRQKLYFDADLPVAGIMIYHVDEGTNYTDDGYPGGTGYPRNHYKVAVLAPDGRYDLEKNVNRGDAGDIWTPGTSITWSQSSNPYLGPNFPNTDSYKGGTVYKTYIQISNITASGTLMSFHLRIGLTTPPPSHAPITTKPPSAAPVTSATAPIAPPVKPPTQKPVKPPTQKPVTKPPTRKPFSCLRSGYPCSSNYQCCSTSCRSKKGKLSCA